MALASGGGKIGNRGGVSGDIESRHPVDRLIAEVAATGRPVTTNDIRVIRNYVSGLGFDTDKNSLAGGRLDGLVWEGRALKRTDLMSAGEIHYLRHALKQQEWPSGVTLIDYLSSVRDIILDPESGLAVSRWCAREWHLTVARASTSLKGPGGANWVVIEYRVGEGRWTTAFQPENGLEHFLGDRRRSEVRWLLTPKSYGE